MTRDEILADLLDRQRIAWDMTTVFVRNKDEHGVMDMGAELQALKQAIAELKKLD